MKSWTGRSLCDSMALKMALAPFLTCSRSSFMLPVMSKTNVRDAGGHSCVEYGTTRSTSSLCCLDDGNQIASSRHTQKVDCSLKAVMTRGLGRGYLVYRKLMRFSPYSRNGVRQWLSLSPASVMNRIGRPANRHNCVIATESDTLSLISTRCIG